MNALVCRQLAAGELCRLAEIDRTESITAAYTQHGEELEERTVDWQVPPFFAEGDNDHTLAYQIAFCQRHLAAGGTAVGAFDAERLVGIGVVTPHVRPGIAQLAYLQVSDGYRGQGVGRKLCEMMDDIARAAGDTAMVVSATPSVNTVRFYMGRGFRPTAEPLPELYALEPEDVHLSREL